MKKGQIVTVINLDNYKDSYAESIPFNAELYKTTNHPCYWVRSLVTGKIYELYQEQIAECCPIEYLGEVLFELEKKQPCDSLAQVLTKRMINN
jgi:hypothetical protein